MPIKNFITGGEAVEAARRTIREIEGAQHAPSYGQTQELERAQRVLWGWRAKVGAAVGVVLTTAVLALNPSEETKPIEVPQAPQVSAEKTPPVAPAIEAKTDALIAAVESGFERLEKTLRPKIEAVADENIRGELLGPFEVLKLNKNFNGKNGPRFHREQSEAGTKSAELENPYYFGYRSEDLKVGAVAGFEAPTKTMFLSPSLDLTNLLDFLVTYHELRHAAQDGNIRQQISSEAEFRQYLSFHNQTSGQKKRTEIMHEATAYAYEIEMLNVILDGELERAITAGESIDVEALQKKLNARPDQRDTIQLLLEFAQAYYPEAQSKGGLAQRFVSFTAKLHRDKGYDVYIQTEHGYEPFNK